jgi:hypothetical protein
MPPADTGGELAKAREPTPVQPPAQEEPSTKTDNLSDIDTESSGQSAPDFGVSEIITFQLSEREPAPREEQWTDAPGWTWDGRNWTISERPGSQRTRQFYLRVKDTSGKWRYAAATSLSFAEYNRRFTNKKFVADRLHKATRKQAYEKFKEFCFETWRAQTIRTDLAPHGPTAGHI